MVYRLYDTAQGQFCIDWDTCTHIIRSYHRSELMLANSKEERESQATTINPTTWGLPDLVMLTVDWSKVREESTKRVLSSAHSMAFRAIFQQNGVDAMVNELRSMQARTRANTAAYQKKASDISRKAFQEIESCVAKATTALYIAKGVRDISASILVAYGTVLTGGAAAAAIGGGAAATSGGVAVGVGGGTLLKATAKYQDAETNAVGVALVEAAQTFITTVVPMGKGVKILVSTTGDTGKSLIEGKSIGTAVAVGLVNVVTGPFGDKVKSTLGGILEKVAASVVTKIGQDKLKQTLQGAIKNAGQPGASSSAATGKASDLMESLVFEDSFLIKWAVVDMEKGIGQSWW